MKPYILYFTFLVFCLSCNDKPIESITVSVLSDKTDSIIPEPSMTHIKPFFADPKYADGKRIFRFQTITNTDVNSSYRAEIKPKSLFGNSLEYKSLTDKFYKRIDTLLKTQNNSSKAYYNSSVIKPLMAQLYKMKQMTTSTKVVLLYSDILEASDLFNVYSSKGRNALLNNTEQVIETLNSNTIIPDLNGVELYIIYYPKSNVDNRLFDKMCLVYQSLFKDSGLKIHVGIDNPLTQ